MDVSSKMLSELNRVYDCLVKGNSTILTLLLLVLGAVGLSTSTKFIIKTTLVLLQTFVLPGVSLKKYGAGKGAWAVITGASDGIGKEFAFQLARSGFNILLVSRTEEKLRAVASEIGSKFSSCTTEILAIDFSALTKDQYAALTKFGADKDIGVLVNNVGLSYIMPTSFVDISIELQDAIVDINIKSMLRVTKILLPNMIKRRKGLILNMTSFSGTIPSPFLAVYSGSKAFIQTFSDAMQSELSGTGVDIQTIHAYFVATSMSRIRRTSVTIPSPKDFVRAALGKIGQPCGALATDRPSASTPYWSHSLLDYLIHVIGWKPAFIGYISGLHKDIRRRALRKQERERASAKKD